MYKLLIIPILIIQLLLTSCVKEVYITDEIQRIGPRLNYFDGRLGQDNHSAIIANDQNIVVCGYDNSRPLLLKINDQGNFVSSTEIALGYESFGRSFVQLLNNDFLIAGNKNVSSRSLLELYRCNENGVLLWTESFGETEAKAILALTDSLFLIVVQKDNLNASINLMYFHLREGLVSTHNISNSDDLLFSQIIKTIDDHVLLVLGRDYYQDPQIDVLKIDNSGYTVWRKSYGQGLHSKPKVLELPNQNFIIAGNDISYSSITDRNIILKMLNSNGDLLWEKNFGNDTINELINGMVYNEDNTITVLGHSYESYGREKQILLFKIDLSGEIIWQHEYPNDAELVGTHLLKTKENDLVIIGKLGTSIFMNRLSSEGEILDSNTR